MVAHIFLDPTFGCGHLANQTSPSSPSSDCSPSPKLLTVNDFSPTTPRVGTFCCCFFCVGSECWVSPKWIQPQIHQILMELLEGAEECIDPWLKPTAKAPKNGCLEDDRFPALGNGLFSGASC